MLSRRLTRTATLFVLLSVAISGAHALTPTEIFAKTSPSVWGVKTYDKDGLPLASGSAVVVAPETLVTNCHVLRKSSRVTVTFENVSIGATLELWDTPRDLCQIKAKNLKAPAVRIGSASALAVGQSIYTLGNPKGLELTLGAGLVSSLRKNDKAELELVQISAPISPGSSGGGLFDDQARLVGITTLQIKDGQNLNFAIPADWIKDLPARHAAKQQQDEQQTHNKGATSKIVSIPAKVWRYRFSEMHGKRREIFVSEKPVGDGAFTEEPKVGSSTLTALAWAKDSSILRMRSGDGVEWVEVSPDLFRNAAGSRSLRDAAALGDTYNLTFRYLGEEPIMVGGKSYSATRLIISGQKSVAPNSVAFMASAFNLTAWYSQELGRIIRSQFSTMLLGGQILDSHEMLLTSIPE